VFSDMEDVVRGVFAFEAYKLYPYLSAQYPDSVFILNTRDVEKWLRSRLEHGGYAKKWKTVLNVESDEELLSHWRYDWQRHHENVERYFSNSERRFLKLDIENDSPEKINHALPEYQLDLSKYSIRGRSNRDSADEADEGP
jgi:Sulfotransferase domain